MYPFLALSGDPFPRLYRFRGNPRDGIGKKYVYGPFPFISDLDDTIKLVQKICQIRTCSDSVMGSRKRPCILHQVGLCSAPCRVAQESAGGRVAMARRILSGRIGKVVSDLAKKMKAASKSRDFESAAKFLGQIQSLQATVRTAMLERAEEGKK
jgi:excinuclease ABC subunit C